MGEVEIKHPKLFSESWENLPESVKISCKQSAEDQEERLFLAQLQQSKNTYLVCFDNGFAYGSISALDLYNYLTLKMRYNEILNSENNYLQKAMKEQYPNTIINPNLCEEKAKKYLLELKPLLNEIVQRLQLYPFPCGEIEKIIDETTNQVVKL